MRVLFAGRFDPFKDPLTFIRAAKLLPQHTFLLAGDGKLLGDCKREAEGLGNVSFYPWLSRCGLSFLRESCQVFCQLSPVENIWAGSLIEAMKAGLAVVCTDVGYTSRFLTDFYHVLLVPPHNPEALAVAIGKLEGEAVRLVLGRNAAGFVSRHLTIERIAGQIIEVAKDVC